MIKQDCFFGSIDLKNAYFLVLVADEFKKYLRFCWNNNLHEFQCMCFGLVCAPRIFTKPMKPIFAHLHAQGFACTFYLDDSLLFNLSSKVLRQQLDYSLKFVSTLGLIPNLELDI